MWSSAPVDETDVENASDEEDPEELGSEEEFLSDTRSIQAVVDSASNEPYSFPEDAYSNAMMAVIKPSGGNFAFKVMRVIVAIAFMVVIYNSQWLVSWAVLEEARRHAMNPAALTSVHVLDRLCSDLNTPGLRIEQARSEEICGTFLWRETGHVSSGARAGSYEAQPDWSLFKEWVGDMPALQETIYQHFATSFFTVNDFTGGFIIAICAWTSAIIAELREICLFLHYTTLSLPRGPACYALAADGGLLLQSLNCKHKTLAVLIVVGRVALALFLWVVGVVFLLGTSSISDVILNAMALGFVLELDTVIFIAANACTGRQFLTSVRVQGSPREAARVETPSSVGSLCRRPACTCFWNTICIVVIMTSAMLGYNFKRHSSQLDWLHFSQMCLYGGPAPTLNNVYDEVFPVPGFCESLLKMDGLKNASGARVHVTKPAYNNLYNDELVEKCLDMLHNTSSISNERESDPDLADLGVTDTVGNFWCAGGRRFCYKDSTGWHWNIFLDTSRGFCQ